MSRLWIYLSAACLVIFSNTLLNVLIKEAPGSDHPRDWIWISLCMFAVATSVLIAEKMKEKRISLFSGLFGGAILAADLNAVTNSMNVENHFTLILGENVGCYFNLSDVFIWISISYLAAALITRIVQIEKQRKSKVKSSYLLTSFRGGPP